MILGTAKKEDESYANANCTHRCVCAAAMLLWYVYILMKGDDQA